MLPIVEFDTPKPKTLFNTEAFVSPNDICEPAKLNDPLVRLRDFDPNENKVEQPPWDFLSSLITKGGKGKGKKGDNSGEDAIYQSLYNLHYYSIVLAKDPHSINPVRSCLLLDSREELPHDNVFYRLQGLEPLEGEEHAIPLLQAITLYNEPFSAFQDSMTGLLRNFSELAQVNPRLFSNRIVVLLIADGFE